MKHVCQQNKKMPQIQVEKVKSMHRIIYTIRVSCSYVQVFYLSSSLPTLLDVFCVHPPVFNW